MQLENKFTWADYTIFVISLLVSLVIGIYMTFSGKKKKTVKDFYLGDQKLNYVAVALSTAATYLSAIGILGIPGEVYTFGFSYGFNTIYKLFMHLTCLFVIIPFFYNLQLPSVYEYFEHRFHRSLRLLACGLFIMNMMSYMAVVLYAPALSLSQGMQLQLCKQDFTTSRHSSNCKAVIIRVLPHDSPHLQKLMPRFFAVSGLPIWSAILVSGLICTIYTALGGIKAVIWTDAFQMSVMAVGNIAVFVFGIVSAGGVNKVWSTNYDEGRLGISYNFDPTIRHTFWSVVIGGYFTGGLPYILNQSLVQRFLSVKSQRTAQKMYAINIPVVWIWEWILLIMGLVMYAYYKGCDPQKAGRIERPDQMMAIFVQDTLSRFMGFPGLFLAVVYSATLSTVSSGVNSVVMVLNEDFIMPVLRRRTKLRDETTVRISKFLSFCVGFLAIGMAFGASAMGKRLMQLCLTITGLCSGPIGALTGVLIGIALSFWIGLGAFVAQLPQVTFPVNADSCNFDLSGPFQNQTSNLTQRIALGAIETARNCNYTDSPPKYSLECLATPTSTPELSGLDVLYSISYQYYGFIGAFTTIIIATLVSCLTGGMGSQIIPEKFFLYSIFTCSNRERRVATVNNTEYITISQFESGNTPLGNLVDADIK
ncbi:sodium-coupled monocarboxylate transporter 1-like isoform X2 [Paramacrobiotus metropolitanus]|uniref:sodium-coupled monocarboxylate transporter 1-like isoform X2 n=1 Tax=Paramacrobiotus metropolitanus TaxID=2943436 RepID=UPI0024464770|nr:sodium-coupled monocarboxylate transporter 1-like isoform X2 [Paramacrobiotus metropolitanus]